MAHIGKTLTNIFHFLSAQGVTFVLGFASSIVLARTLGPNDLGIFHQIQWFAGTISVILSMGFITSIVRFTARYRAQNQPEKQLSLVRYIFNLELVISLTATVGLVWLAPVIADHYFTPQQGMLFSLAFLAITPGMQTAIFSAMLEGAQIFRYQSLHAVTITPVALLTKIGLLLGGYGIEALLWSNLIFSVVNLIYYWFAGYRENLLKGWYARTRGDGSWKAELWRYNRSVTGIQMIDLVVWSRSENYFLGRYCSASQIAYYNLAQNLVAKFFGLFSSMVWRILLPVISEQQSHNEEAKMRKTYQLSVRYTAILIFPLLTICYMSAYELVVVFFGQEYAEVKTSFQILLLGAFFSALAQPGAAAMYACDRQSFILWYGSLLAALNIALNFWLIPTHGAVGASISYAAITSMGVMGGFVFLHRKMGLTPPIYSLVKIALSCALLAIVLFWSLRQPTTFFDFFLPLQNWLESRLGHRFDILFSARTVKLVFSVGTGVLFYGFIVVSIFRPNREDLRILMHIERYLPPGLFALLEKRGRRSP